MPKPPKKPKKPKKHMSVTVTKLIGYAVMGWGDNVAVTKLNAYSILSFPQNSLAVTKLAAYVVYGPVYAPAAKRTRKMDHVQC